MLQIERLTMIASDRALIRHVAPAKMVRESERGCPEILTEFAEPDSLGCDGVVSDELPDVTAEGVFKMRDSLLPRSVLLSFFCGKWAELPSL